MDSPYTRVRLNPAMVVLALASLFPIYAAYRHTAFLNDDIFITLTYAKNLAAGKGFVYNHPPPTLGTTTPLFTLAIAGLGRVLVQLDIAQIAVYFTSLCWIGTAWVFYLFRRCWQLQDWQAGVIGLTIIASGPVGFLGMEVYLFSFLLVTCLSLFFCNRYFLAGVTAGLLFLTRGEGVLVIPLMAVIAFARGWGNSRRLISLALFKPLLVIGLGFALPVLFWLIYAQHTFGSFLPNTLLAKQAQGQNGLGKSFLPRLVHEWLPSWGTQFVVLSMPFLNLWWLLIVAGAATSLWHRRRWLVFAAWLALYIMGYVALGVSAYWWYQLPIVFVLQLYFGLGVIAGIELISAHVQARAVSLALSIVLAGAVLLILARPTVTAVLKGTEAARGPSYVALGQWIRDHAAPTDTVAFLEIGYLGYYTENPIIDLAGLTLPDIVPHIAEGDFAWGFWHYLPDYYIYLPNFDWALASIHAHPDFDQRYRQVAALRGPGELDFVIYRRIQ